MSENTRSKGTITLNGIGSIPVSVPVSSFGEGFTSKDIGNVKNITIMLDTGNYISIDLSDPATFKKSITISRNNAGTVDTDVCPPPIDPITNLPMPNRC